jgi:hypothetical protein
MLDLDRDCIPLAEHLRDWAPFLNEGRPEIGTAAVLFNGPIIGVLALLYQCKTGKSPSFGSKAFRTREASLGRRSRASWQ